MLFCVPVTEGGLRSIGVVAALIEQVSSCGPMAFWFVAYGSVRVCQCTVVCVRVAVGSSYEGRFCMDVVFGEP